MQQLSSLWDDYQAKINEQLNGHIMSYASHFPEAKVSHVHIMSVLSLNSVAVSTLLCIVCKHGICYSTSVCLCLSLSLFRLVHCVRWLNISAYFFTFC